jgi:hypothetical protein
MSPPLKYGIPAAWLLLIVYRAVTGPSEALRWALGALTLALLVVAVTVVVDFVATRVQTAKRGERVFTHSTIRGLLAAGLIAGFLLRFVVGGDDPGGVVAWAGGIIGALTLGGLLLLGFLRARARAKNPSFYFDPNWTYGLVLVCIAALVAGGVVGSNGTLTGVAILVFWLALIALVVQTVGRRILILRRRGPGSGAVVR